MSSSGDDRPSREVAWRLFAAEFDDADFSYAESDEERAPNYVVTPTGARVNRMFAVGVLTEVEQVSDDVLRARIVDPTGAFVVYAGQYQPDALASLEQLDAPAFVAVTGKARTFEPDDADTVYTSIRPESISEVDAETRDRWVVRTAEQTIDRVGVLADALGSDARGDDLRDALVSAGVRPDLAAGVPLAIEHYGTTETYLDALRTLAVQAAEVVAGDREEVERLTVAPDEGGPTDADIGADLDVEAAEPTDESADAEPVSEASTEDVEAEPEVEPEPEPESEAEAEPESASAVEAEPDAADAGDVGTTEELAESTAQEPDAVEPEVDAEPETAEGETGTVEPESESEPEPDSELTADAAPESDAEPESEPEPEPAAASEDEGESTLGDFDSRSDDMYEFDEEEREEIEEEFDMEFSSGDEIPDAGEAGIEPEAEPIEGDEEPDEEMEEGADVFEGDLEDLVVDTMDDLDQGDGVDHDEVVRAVVEETDADPGDVEDAIQSALMSGRCYESGEDTLKAI